MLTYRGDKFIKGKKFIINESIYRFQKRDNKDNLMFESESGDILKLTEADFNKKTVTAENVSDEQAVEIVKSYYEDGNNDNRVLASDIIKLHALDVRYPRLMAYLKKSLEKAHEERNKNPFENGTVEHAIQNVANEYGISFENRTPFEDFYAPDSDGEGEDDKWYSADYDWADFYDKILHDLGYGENPVLNDLRAEVHERSDGKYEMHLMVNNKPYIVDLRAWDKLEDVKNNVEYIVSLFDQVDLKEGLSFEEESDKILNFDEAVKGYIDFELGMDDMDPDTAKYLKGLSPEDVKVIARRVQNQVDEELNEVINYYLYEYKKEKLDLPNE